GAEQTANFDRMLSAEIEARTKAFESQHRELLVHTAVFREVLEGLPNYESNLHAQLWNIGLHINMAHHDLSVTVWAMAKERDVWTRKLLARQAIVITFESIRDTAAFLGGPVRNALNALNILDR